MLSLLVTGEGGRELVLDGERLHVGRGADNELVLTGERISRRHAAFVRNGTRWFVEDLGSSDGLFVNGARVQRHPLRPGDRLGIGSRELEVRRHQLDRDTFGAWAALTLATDAQRQVHADDLEMKGQVALANWVRAEVALRALPAGSPEWAQQQRALALLGEKLAPHWRALAARARIEGCSQASCPGEWAKLALGEDLLVRGCAACRQNVRWCDTLDEARDAYGAPLVVDPGRPRTPGDLLPRAPYMPVG